MTESIAPKAYYSIGEVCDITGLRPHVLRYWETQFDELRPTKNRAGNRVYRPRDVELVLLVKHLLYTERFTIAGARRKLGEMQEAGNLEEEGAKVLEPEIIRGMRWELDRLREVLSPSGDPPSPRSPESGGPADGPGADDADEPGDGGHAGHEP